MLAIVSGRRSAAVGASLLGLVASVASVASAGPASAQAQQFYFFEETASAFWAVPHQCADGSTVQATLLVLTTRDFEAPETEDADPTARVQYQAVCSGSSCSIR